jgi:hypothetical protein
VMIGNGYYGQGVDFDVFGGEGVDFHGSWSLFSRVCISWLVRWTC